MSQSSLSLLYFNAIFYLHSKSLIDGKYYYGHCENLAIRIKRHNNGLVRSTKSRKPFILHYSEKFSPKFDAAKKEYFVKTMTDIII